MEVWKEEMTSSGCVEGRNDFQWMCGRKEEMNVPVDVFKERRNECSSGCVEGRKKQMLQMMDGRKVEGWKRSKCHQSVLDFIEHGLLDSIFICIVSLL